MTTEPNAPYSPEASAPQAYPQQAPYAGYGQAPLAPKTNVLAIVSLVTSFVVSLAAIITGHIALRQIARTGESGRGLAIAGLIIGYTGFAFGLIFFAITIAALATYSS